MANEGVLKFGWPTAGLANVTAKILKPDDTVRDSQSAEALDDTGHDKLYTNAGAITIQTGDTVQVFIGTDLVGLGTEYRPETASVALRTTIASVSVADTKFVLTDGPAITDILFNAVIEIYDISGGFSVPRRISAYTSGKEVTLDTDAGFALTAGDVVRIWANSYEGELGTVATDQIADAVWDELVDDHQINGSTGRRLAAHTRR
ncbi:hypothetical protein LCGC14_0844610 [marine sediment metagenome]|uniref:Uncharacterized protein n=1 Tax=marine sediment metagenome TaxID=412755 RepID=A0A0F9PXB1_9ZZZZ|nr:hypothetical protein [Pricia sp.]